MYPRLEDLSFKIIIVEIKHTHGEDQFTITNVTRPAAELLEYSQNQLLNQPLSTISFPERSKNHWTALIDQLNRDNTIECELLTRSKHQISVLLSLSKLPSDSNGPNTIALLIQNIGNRKQLDKDLFIMHRAVEQSASAVVITDPDGRIEYVNPKYTELTGFSSEELINQNPRMLQSGTMTAEQYQSMWSSLIETGEWRGELKNKKKNGVYYWVRESISAIKNSQGEITHFLSIAEDVTQSKHVENALSESEQRFRQMAEMTGEWLWEQDPAGYYIYSSIAVKKILGLEPEEIIGKHYTELLTTQDKVGSQAYAENEQPFFALINHYQHKDGHQVFAESTGLPIKNNAGKLIKWRGVDRDITARKHFEDALIESEQRKRLIVESSLNAIVIMDSLGIITDWNNQAEKMFGWSRKEAIGQHVEELIIPKHLRNAHRLGLEQFLRSGKGPIMNQLIEQVAIRRDGSEFPVELSVAPLKLGNAYIFSGFIHDITSRKESEEKIRQAQVNLAIAHSEMMIAHRIQSSLLPSASINSEQFEITGICLPATQVGGDYYDYFHRDDEHLNMVIADVSGHSIGPALFMVETRSALRSQSNWPASPSETVKLLNNFLYEDLYNADYFITLFYAQYDCNTGNLTYANGGHPKPLLLDGKLNQYTELDAEGLILGIRQNVIFEEKTVHLNPGDMILFYTDGIIEAENEAGDFFGSERICTIFQQCAQQSPKKIIEELQRQLKLFCGKESFNDDITLMIFKRN
jgi:phosphoserine phosphatase RsbU/P